MKDNIILDVKNLKQYFTIGSGRGKVIVKAVDDISFSVKKGEVFSLVGESGCGKTTTGRTLINLYEATSGTVDFLEHRTTFGTLDLHEKKKDILKKKRAKIKELQGIQAEHGSDTTELDIQNVKDEATKKINEINLMIKEAKKVNHDKTRKEIMNKMQMIFQDPIASLNPRMTVKEIIAEGLRIKGEKDDEVITEKVNMALEKVGLLPEHATRYPHEFSGGQRQRIGIARVLVVNPDFIIADEPISALDISIQAQVINLLNDLRNEFGITILFIAHDLSVVKYFSDRIAVMYFGKIVEMGDKDLIFNNPIHPYTKALISAIPIPDPYFEKKRKKRLKYSPSIHDYSTEKPSMHEIYPGHFVFGSDSEIKKYKHENNKKAN